LRAVSVGLGPGGSDVHLLHDDTGPLVDPRYRRLHQRLGALVREIDPRPRSSGRRGGDTAAGGEGEEGRRNYRSNAHAWLLAGRPAGTAGPQMNADQRWYNSETGVVRCVTQRRSP